VVVRNNGIKINKIMEQQKQHIGFAKKYRPGSFKELYGQGPAAKILSYAIINNRLAGGYLLTGIRGVGKTTSARIIAKTINCESPVIINEDISPCGKCKNCAAFMENSHPDVLEIDAASRTGVDDIRVIIESSEYRPLLGKYKIFIIDEIHMLSKSAFNALLKVLEEPPPHIIFIFATTEIQKLPVTIISRCQRLDLKRLKTQEICELLRKISDVETLLVDQDAINIIAEHSEGSARDAISLLDQAVNIKTEEKITAEIINNILGSIDTGVIIKFLKYTIDNDLESALKLVNEVYLNGASLELFIISVSNVIAYLSKAKLLPDYSHSLYQAHDSQIADILSQTNIAGLSILWQIFALGSSEVKSAHNQLISTEMLAIKAIYSTTIFAKGNTQGSNEQDKILAFLKYLHESNEVEVYYALMNELEIKRFADNTLEIAGNVSLKFKTALLDALFKWNGQKYEITVTKQEKVTSFKTQLVDNIKKSPEWKKIKQLFPSANISDILSLKTSV
jgi:DNA polymerase III subunit gamma/tau